MTTPAGDGAPKMTQSEFEEARTKLRQMIFASSAFDLAIAAAAAFWLDAAVIAAILVVVAFVATPLILSSLDRGWRRQGYDVP